MKKFQIFKKKAGQEPEGNKYAIFDTMAEAQDELWLNCREFFENLDNYNYYSEYEISTIEVIGDVKITGYTEPGIYKATGENTIELVYSDREIESADFWRYQYDNWEEYIEEIEVQDERNNK